MKNKTTGSNKRVIKDFIAKAFYGFKSMGSAKNILFFYLIIMFIGALLLWAPFSQTNVVSGKKGQLSFIDSMFTAASAFSDTGLSTMAAGETFNIFGQAVLAILIFIGGIGWFALKVYIFNIIFGRTISFKTRDNLSAERGSVKIGVTRSLVRIAVTTLLIVTIIASAVLTIYFYYTNPSDVSKLKVSELNSAGNPVIKTVSPYHNPYIALRWGIFHSISAINNAGFDIMGSSSLQAYYSNYGVQIVFMLLFILGGIGYPVIYDLYMRSKTKFTGEPFRWSLFTKLSMTAYIIVAIIGLSVTFGIEASASDSLWNSKDIKYGGKGHKTMALVFNTMSTRNAGFSTISMHDISKATMINYLVMMFIGSAPSSTAGGIRTTTIAIVVLSIWSRLKGRKSVYAFKRRISTSTVNRSYVVFGISIMLVFIATLISITSLDVHGGRIPTVDGLLVDNKIGNLAGANPTQKVYSLTELVFEVGSAFGTTGLSAGITPLLSNASKVSLILIMFIGQLGVSSSILIWGRRDTSEKHYSRTKIDVAIG